METYAKILLVAIPGFLVLVILELFYGTWKKKQTYTLMDTISSLSSGMTNLLKDLFGVGIVIVSYPYLMDNLALFSVEESKWIYVIAFICIDFASYWGHRLNHSINVFWNQHVVHHSSEEFNLACALRQSISGLIGFGALFLLPAALLGVPPKVITLLAPLHLFGQFWYHTQHIGKLGWLEYVLVTPSQHRVHHAINPIYIDKNLSAIFCVWDRLFGTFQEELEAVPCVYGTLKPVKTWNPILINFQHLWGLCKDAWHTKNWRDKLTLWFMPTGWRPKDVRKRFPRESIEDVYTQRKYAPAYTLKHKIIALFQFMSVNVFLYLFLSNFALLNPAARMAFGILIFVSIFGYTSLLDGNRWALIFEITRSIVGILIVFHPAHTHLWASDFLLLTGFTLYFTITLLTCLWVGQSLPDRGLIPSA